MPYDIVLEMDEINDDLPETELVIGANVNPGAETDTSIPIYGMPLLQVWKFATVVVFKRDTSAGYAGVQKQNRLISRPRTRTCFDDAKKATMQGILSGQAC